MPNECVSFELARGAAPLFVGCEGGEEAEPSAPKGALALVDALPLLLLPKEEPPRVLRPLKKVPAVSGPPGEFPGLRPLPLLVECVSELPTLEEKTEAVVRSFGLERSLWKA